MKKRILILLLAMVLMQPCFQSRAQTVPDKMNYQGVIANSSGVPLPTGDYNLVFRIFGAATGGTPTWGPKTNLTSVVAGQFNVALGPLDDATPTPRALSAGFATGTRFLEIQVGANPPILPRQQILSAPYAFEAGHAANATTASTLVNSSGTPLITSSGNSVTVAGPVTASSFTGNGAGLNSLTASQIPSLDAGKITTGILGTAQIPSLDGSKVTGNLDGSKITGSILDARLSSNVAMRNVANTFNGGQIIAGVGTYDGLKISGGNTLTGMMIENTAVGGHQFAFFAQNDGRFQINDNTPSPQQRLTISATGNVGIGTATPAAKLDVRGDIKLGTSGQYFAPAADENLRIVRGIVNGTTASGLNIGGGYGSDLVLGVTKPTTTISFNQPFTGIPAITVTPVNTPEMWHIDVRNVTTNSFQVIQRRADNVPHNTTFHFIAVGPR